MIEDLRLHGLLGGAALEKNFLLKYDGVSDVIVDLKGNPIQVAVDDYVYNEFNYTKLEGETGSYVIDRTTPVQVTNQTRTIEGSGGRKSTRLDNGWLVVSLAKGAGLGYELHVSKDGGETWSRLCYISDDSSWNAYHAVVSYGTKVFWMIGSTTSPYIFTIEATTQTDTAVPVTVNNKVDSGQTTVFGFSLAVNKSNGYITAAWASKNSTYPNSYNIRSIRSVDGTAWTKQDGSVGVDQLTTSNTSGIDWKNPCVVYMNNGNPIVIFDGNYTSISSFFILAKAYLGSAWNTDNATIFSPGNYAQYAPSAAVDSNGVIHITWYGKDATHSVNNVVYSMSEDNGVTWSTSEWLTSETTYTRIRPTVAIDKNNIPHVVLEGSNVDSIMRVYRMSKVGGSWSVPVEIASYFGSWLYPNTCDDYTDFEFPLTVFVDSSGIKFYGKWTDILTPTQIIPPMSLATDKTELKAIYADTLKMHSPNTDARYQGFVSKKDYWTTALQDLDWVSESIVKGFNLFGVVGTGGGEKTLSMDTITGVVSSSRPRVIDCPKHVVGFVAGDTTGNISVVNKATGAKTLYTLPLGNGSQRLRPGAGAWWANGNVVVIHAYTIASSYYYMYVVFFNLETGAFTIKWTSPQGSVRYTLSACIVDDDFYITPGQHAQDGVWTWSTAIYKIPLSLDSMSTGYASVANVSGQYYADTQGQPVIKNGFMYYPNRYSDIHKINLSGGAVTVLYDNTNSSVYTDRSTCGGTDERYFVVNLGTSNDLKLREVNLSTDAVSLSKAFSNWAFIVGAFGNGWNGKGLVSWRNFVYSDVSGGFLDVSMLTEVKL